MKLLLLLLTAGKLGKLLVSGGSMIFAVVAYAFVFGWAYAVGFVVLLLVHEMGHYLAARQRGLDLMAVLAFPQVVKAWKFDPAHPDNQAYYAASAETRMTYALYYLGLLAFLAVMAHDTHEMLGPLRP